MENNNQSITNCSSCRASLPVDSRHRTCQACRERVAASRRRRRAENQQEEAGVVTRPRGRPRRTVESVDAESRPRGRPRSDHANSMPAAYISQLSRLRPLELGRMDKECPNCHALHWIDERQQNSSQSSPVWESCCKQGLVQLPLLAQPPGYLKDLLARTDAIGRQFKDNLRQYNAAFAFTSLGCNIASAEERTSNENSRGGLHAFQIHGELYHLQGPLLPSDDSSNPSYAQLYIYDPSYAAERRSERNNNLDPEIIRELSFMLSQCNPFARIYRHAYEILNERESNNNSADNNNASPYIAISPDMRMRLIEGGDRRTQNLPTTEEVAAIIPTEYGDRSFRDIVLILRGAVNSTGASFRDQYSSEYPFQRISQTHAAYMPTHYVLLFPHGDYGWHWGMRLSSTNITSNNHNNNNNEGDDVDVSGSAELIRTRDRLSQRSFYRFRLHLRGEYEFPTIFYSKRLFQQFLVDTWAICDQNKLEWLRNNQDRLRADVYNGLSDAITQDDQVDAASLGRRFILPSSYHGGPRFMSRLYYDSMAIVRHFGKPSLFITFTANPKWKEITEELLPGQTASDRPDLIARVFNIKVKHLLNDLKKKQIFGRYKGLVRTIEYQKRGLPHLHLLLFLDPEDNFVDAEKIDQVISAELPNKNTDRELFEIITSCMLHGPCGDINPRSPCMVEGAGGGGLLCCSKRFPKEFQDETVMPENGYPLYRRRRVPAEEQNNYFYSIRPPGRVASDFVMDNRWVVPYNPYLSKKYKAHINVEVCAGIQAIKYVNKYIYKGSDRTTLEIENSQDEIKKYLQGRYIGPTEAVWNIFQFKTHEEDPTVISLQVHLPGEQAVCFPSDASAAEIATILERNRTTLMAFFDYNARNEDGRQYLYQEFPQHFVFDERRKKWHPRQRGFAIGRMYHCSPIAGERYYLRLLLTSVRGPRSFEDIRTVNGVLYPTFREACVALHLIEDDREWDRCFAEARLFATGANLRRLFVTALFQGQLNNPLTLWERYCSDMCDDLANRLLNLLGDNFTSQILNQASYYNNNPAIDYGLYLVNDKLEANGKSLQLFNLPEPLCDWNSILPQARDGRQRETNPLIRNALNFNPEEALQQFNSMYNQLNEQQKNAFDAIVNKIESDPLNSQFFLQGPAGTGKTFVYNTLCNYYKSRNEIVLCVASSGIAALLLPDGQTSHSLFKIPLSIDECSTCSIRKDSSLAEMIRRAKLIIWDEVPMQHKYCFEAVHRTFQDICDDPDELYLFGGKPVVLGGDFAQIPPVVRRGNRADTVSASIRQSFLWPRLHLLRLTQNMRLTSLLSENDTAFARFLADMSYNSSLQGNIVLPSFIHQTTQLAEFISRIYRDEDIRRPNLSSQVYFGERAILASRNDTVDTINMAVLEKMPGEKVTLLSTDSADINDADGLHTIPAEYLQSLNPSGLPPSQLELKVGAPVMLLRNIDPARGLCNGTRLIVVHIGQYMLRVRLANKPDAPIELIPRFTLSTLEGNMPFMLTRKQFPVKLCFAMTINKSQGQSLKYVGVDLRRPPFMHGQLYVALSRVTSLSGVSVLLPENTGTTNNVVYSELLLN